MTVERQTAGVAAVCRNLELPNETADVERRGDDGRARIESEYREMPRAPVDGAPDATAVGTRQQYCDPVLGVPVSGRVLVKARRDAYARSDRLVLA